MAQPSKVAGRGGTKRKSINVPLGSSAGGSAPSVSSEFLGAARPSEPSQNLPAIVKQQAQEKKYPLWKYVTRKHGLGSKLVGGGNVVSFEIFARVNSRAHTIMLKAICWNFLVDLQHAKWSMLPKGMSWKKRILLA